MSGRCHSSPYWEIEMKKTAQLCTCLLCLVLTCLSATYTINSRTCDDNTISLTFSLENHSPTEHLLELFDAHSDSTSLPVVQTRIMTNGKSTATITHIEFISDTIAPPNEQQLSLLKDGISHKPFLDSGFTFRDVKGYHLTIPSFYYLKEIDKLIIHKEIRITIAGEFATLPDLLRDTPTAFRHIFKEQFCNYPHETLQRNKHYLSDGDKMVIISHQDYITEMEPLKRWKELRGIHTTLVSYPSETGSGIENLQSYISELYTEQEPTYLILVGDATDIPPQISFPYDSAASDPTYVMLEGGEYDWYPEMLLGRLSVSTPDEAALVVRKIINYEKSPSSSNNWSRKALVISDDDYYSVGNGTTTMDKISDTCVTILGEGGFQVTKLYDPGATQDELITQINSGKGLIYYMGHGDRALWSTTAFDYEDFPLLNNGWKMPIILSHGCNNGEFDTTTAHQPICLAESFIRTGTIEHGGGAVAFLGGTDGVLQDYQVAFYEMARLLGEETQFSLGTVTCNGKIKALFEGSGAPNMKRLTLFGDPSLQVFTDIAVPFSVTLPDSIADGDQSILLTAPVGSVVTLQTESQNYFACAEITTESTEFPIHDAKSEDIYCTITGKNRVPFLDTIINTKSVHTIHELSTTPEASFSATVQNGSVSINLPHTTEAMQYGVELVSLRGRVLHQEEFTIHRGIVLNRELLPEAANCCILRIKSTDGTTLYCRKLLLR